MRVQRIAPIGSIITHVQTKCTVCGHEWKISAGRDVTTKGVLFSSRGKQNDEI